MFCNKCSHKLPDDSEFCQYCGNKLQMEMASTAEETPNVQPAEIPVPVITIPEISKEHVPQGMPKKESVSKSHIAHPSKKL